MDALSRFAAVAALPESELDLAEMALLIGAAGDPGAEPAPRLAEIDRWAEGVEDLDGLLHRLFRELRFRQVAGAEAAFGPDLLPRVGPHLILVRMLANLRGIYEARRSGPDLEWVARMRLALPDASAREAMALASALELQGRFLEAARELEEYAPMNPQIASELTAVAHRL